MQEPLIALCLACGVSILDVGSALAFRAGRPWLCCNAQVAEVLVEALRQPGASRKVVEVVASKKAPERPPSEWFKSL